MATVNTNLSLPKDWRKAMDVEAKRRGMTLTRLVLLGMQNVIPYAIQTGLRHPDDIPTRGRPKKATA